MEGFQLVVAACCSYGLKFSFYGPILELVRDYWFQVEATKDDVLTGFEITDQPRPYLGKGCLVLLRNMWVAGKKSFQKACQPSAASDLRITDPPERDIPYRDNTVREVARSETKRGWPRSRLASVSMFCYLKRHVMCDCTCRFVFGGKGIVQE